MRVEPGQAAVSTLRDIVPGKPQPGGAPRPAVASPPAPSTARSGPAPTAGKVALLDVGNALDQVVSTLNALGSATDLSNSATMAQDAPTVNAMISAESTAETGGAAPAAADQGSGDHEMGGGRMGGGMGGGGCSGM